LNFAKAGQFELGPLAQQAIVALSRQHFQVTQFAIHHLGRLVGVTN
jgi:hypothetical protein